MHMHFVIFKSKKSLFIVRKSKNHSEYYFYTKVSLYNSIEFILYRAFSKLFYIVKLNQHLKSIHHLRYNLL